MNWKPFAGMQTQVLQSTAFETLAGGARGPGKTDAGVMWLIKPYLLVNPRARSLVIRKNSDDLADWIDRARFYFPRYGAVVTGKPSTIRFPSGYVIRTGHLKDDNAYTKYQGQEYQRILLEELTQIPNEKLYIQLISSCRSTVEGVDPRVLATTNPGGIGHVWVKERFVDPAPWGEKFTDKETGRTRIFIPGKVDENPVLMENDPSYVKSLDGLKAVDEELWKAWRLGSWDVFAGQYFREFRRDTHLVRPFIPRDDLTKVGGLDWGRTAPFAFLASAVSHVKYSGIDKTNPYSSEEKDYEFTRVFTFQEAYGTDKLPREWAQRMNELISIEKLEWIQCDNQIFNKSDTDHSTSIAQQYYDYDPRYYGKLKPASKERITGWEAVRQWLSIAPDGKPYWMIAENCNNLIREIPGLVHDDIKVEDTLEGPDISDHACDAARYMLKAIRWIDAKAGGVMRKQDLQSKHKQIRADRPLNIDAWNE